MVSFCAVFFLRDVLDEIWDLIESVSEGFLPTLICVFYILFDVYFKYYIFHKGLKVPNTSNYLRFQFQNFFAVNVKSYIRKWHEYCDDMNSLSVAWHAYIWHFKSPLKSIME